MAFTPCMLSQTKSKPVKPAAVQSAWVKKTLKHLSLEEKVGQLIMPAFRGIYLNSNSAEFKEIKRQIQKIHVGGFILFAGDVYESAILIDKMQSLSKLPLLIASDFERGANFRIRSTVSFPWNMAIGATGCEHWAEVEGKITAQEARAMGVNWIFAPVLDVNNNPSNPVINIRSFGEDAELVARLGGAFVRGAQQAGVLATGKHFPGHGDTGVDSHLELPLITADRQRLEKLEFVPFKKAIDNGVWAIMTAHLAVPALESDLNIPATLSRKVVQGVLQQELGFSNLVVTDSLKMAGLANGFWIGDAVVRAVKAGVDVLLDPPNADVVYQALLEATRRGDIPEERLNQSVEKILHAKAWLGLPKSPGVNLEAVSKVIDDPELQEQAQQMADASMTLVRDSRNFLPVDVRSIRSALAVLVLGRDQQEETTLFEEELRRRLEQLTIHRISTASSDSQLAEVLKEAETADLVICATFARLVTGTGTVGLPEKLAHCVTQLVALEKPVLVIAFGNPYIIQQFSQARAYLCTFSNADVSQTATVKAIFGEIPVAGQLPATLPGIAKIYSGIQRSKLNMKLAADLPGELQPIRDRLSTLESLIERHIRERAFPGASVAIGYRGHLIYQQAFGRFDYSARGTPVTPETIYDLASLTKVVSATTLAMQLFETGQLRLEFPVSRFYPSFTDGGREKITIQHLLTHCSGLPAHLPFYRDTRGKSEFVRKILQTPLEYEPGTKAAYSDLGIILLGSILEKMTARPQDELARKRIFAPLGMTHTLFKPEPSLKSKIAPTENDPWRGRLAQGEVHDNNAFAMGGVSAHAGLFSTSGDLSIFCQMLVNGGVYDHHRIVKRGTLEKFVTRQNLPPGSSRALGWDTPSDESSAGSLLSSKSFGHTGFTGTSIWVDPTRQLFIILLSNRVYPTHDNNAIREVRREVADAVVRAIEGTK
jgi:beta-glucosidase-like glycosyl hydrolase/CubicO group peptidase (beta-lactamase class C family)